MNHCNIYIEKTGGAAVIKSDVGVVSSALAWFKTKPRAENETEEFRVFVFTCRFTPATASFPALEVVTSHSYPHANAYHVGQHLHSLIAVDQVEVARVVGQHSWIGTAEWAAYSATRWSTAKQAYVDVPIEVVAGALPPSDEIIPAWVPADWPKRYVRLAHACAIISPLETP